MASHGHVKLATDEIGTARETSGSTRGGRAEERPRRMKTEQPAPPAFALGPLLRGESAQLAEWVRGTTLARALPHALLVLVGAGAFGAAMGSWRAPEQALASGLKLPFVLLGTAAGNALINGMLAPLLGLDLRLKESFAAVLASFALLAAILGAFAPIMAFLVWNLPPPQPGVPMAAAARNVMLLTLVGTIAFAGVVANVRLLQLLRRLGGGASAGLRLLFAWLAVNLLLGSQLSWNTRPYIGHADVPTRFLSDRAFEGSFFEELLRTAAELLSQLLS